MINNWDSLNREDRLTYLSGMFLLLDRKLRQPAPELTLAVHVPVGELEAFRALWDGVLDGCLIDPSLRDPANPYHRAYHPVIEEKEGCALPRLYTSADDEYDCLMRGLTSVLESRGQTLGDLGLPFTPSLESLRGFHLARLLLAPA